jgi:cytochrome c biogenesis protein CcmG/thiol:disulfide interchange protein DsbE
VVVNVWASWCPPCRTEAPLLQRAADDYDSRVVFLGVDSRDDADVGREFLDRYGISYPNVFDGSGTIRRLLGVREFPTTYIFGTHGELSAEVTDGISEQTLAAHLDNALRP